jgi:hypothetical protein
LRGIIISRLCKHSMRSMGHVILRYDVIGCTNVGVSWMCILVHIIPRVSRLGCLSKLNTITTLRSLGREICNVVRHMRSLALEIISEEVLRHPTNGKTITECLTESLDRHLSCKGECYYVTTVISSIMREKQTNLCHQSSLGHLGSTRRLTTRILQASVVKV